MQQKSKIKKVVFGKLLVKDGLSFIIEMFLRQYNKQIIIVPLVKYK